MTNPREPVPVSLEQRREWTIRALCRHVAVDVLTLEEFERRIDVAHRARSILDLDRLIGDLPTLDAEPAEPGPASIRPYHGERRGHQLIAAIMGGASRKGQWVPARRTTVVAFMGGADLDFREAQIGPGETEVQIFAIWGGVQVIVPPGLAVETGGIAIMGGFEQTDQEPARRTADAPLLRITGLALMGGVEVIVRLPGETARDARRRRREERRRLREQRRLESQ